MVTTGDIIVFGIVSGLRLLEAGRRAYVESTISRDLVLPLPNFNPDMTVGTATDYFRGAGAPFLEDQPRLRDWCDRVDGGVPLSPEEKKDLLIAYKEIKLLKALESGEVSGREISLNPEALSALIRVRQFARNQSPFPTAFQRVAGSLIQIGIDYFANMPGVVDERSASGKALRGFLQSIDELNFADGRVDELAKSLFIAALETIGNTPSLLAGDDKVEKLVEVVSRGLAKDIRTRVDKLAQKDLSRKEKAEQWGQLVLRSMLGSAGAFVLSNPASYLDTRGPGEEALVSSVGTCLLDLILEEDAVDLSRLFTRESLDRLVRTSLRTLGDHPDLLGTQRRGLKLVLAQAAKDLSQASDILCADILPEMMRLILEKSAANMELLWPEGFRDEPKKHLLITASRELLACLSEQAEPLKPWKPAFSRDHILGVAEVVLDEVVQNPDWVIREAGGKNSVLSQAVEGALEALKRAPAGRIHPGTVTEVLKAAVKAVALRKDLLERISMDGQNTMALKAALETVVDAMLSDSLDPKARWTLAREEVFTASACVALAKLAEAGASESNIHTVRSILDLAANDIRSGRPWSLEGLIGKLKNLKN